MKKNFSLTLEGKDWSKPFITYWILYLIFSIPMNVFNRQPPESVMGSGISGFLSVVFTIVIIIISAAYTIKLARIAAPKLSIDGKAFGFQGAEGKYIGMNVGGFVLSLITISIYVPWYIAKITRYVASETTFDGEKPAFLSKGGKLLGFLILFLWVPIIIVAVIAGVSGSWSKYSGGSYDAGGEAAWLGLLMFFLVIPFIYFFYRWLINFGWKEFTVKWRTSFWPSAGVILGQFLLTVITVGIYWPAAFLKLYRYFAARTVVVQGEDEKVIGRLGFEGSIKKGFGLLWGQTLLSAITIGFYLPWAYPKVARWVLESTYYETASEVNE